MVDPAVAEFFEGRKEDWLKKKINSTMAQDEITALLQECNEQFSLENWLPNAAARISSRALTTHPSKFTHPSTGVGKKNIKEGTYVTPVHYLGEYKNDGFCRTGNVKNVNVDSVGNAADLDVEEFLSIKIDDGKTILNHIESDTPLAVKLLKIDGYEHEALRKGFLSVRRTGGETVTNSKIKQVYFPVDEGYHQLSILTNSGIAFELRKRIDSIRFSDEVKEQRELKKKNEFSENGYSEIYNLTTIGYGGTKPQNISVLNNQNGGKTHLLSSLPPQLQKRQVHFPKSDFFKESFRQSEYLDVFQALHKIIKTDYNNVNIREGRDYRIQELIDRILNKMWLVRSVASNQYHADSSNLKAHQKIWLCDDKADERENSEDWLDRLLKEISTWLILTYENKTAKQKIKLGEQERVKVVALLEQNKEAFR